VSVEPTRAEAAPRGDGAPAAGDPAVPPETEAGPPADLPPPAPRESEPPRDPTEDPRPQLEIATPLVEARPSEPPTRPLLASEALMEDLAPLEPARSAARWWCAALGVGFLLLGALAAAGLRPGGATTAAPSFFLAAVAFVAAVARVAYWRRALAMVVLGLLAAALGLRGAGPAMGLGLGGVVWGLLRMAAATTLGAALLFRSRYRAYRGARRVLVGAFATSLPYVGYLFWHLALSDAGLARVGAGLALAAVLAALTGFMGAETTGAGAFIALAVVGMLSAELSLQALAQPGALASWVQVLEVVSASVAFAVTAGIASLGCFQLLAWRFAADARRIDIHADPTPSAKPRPRDD
jgi:hypothetical protein